MEQKIKDTLQVIKDIIVITVPTGKIYLFGSYADIREIDAMIKIRVAIRDDDIIVVKKNIFEQRKSASTLKRIISERGILVFVAVQDDNA